MDEAIHALAEYVALAVNILAILAIAIGSIQGAIGLFPGLLARVRADRLQRVWLTFGRWLVAGLTFQLASDIVETILTPGWDDIGKLGAVAVIRTFLSYFLNKDMEELRERGRRETAPEAIGSGQPRGEAS